MSKKTLRRWLTLFFVALSLPSAALIYQAYDRLKFESFHQYRNLAVALAGRIDNRYAQLIAQEENRPFSDYNFLVVVGDPQSGFVQRSPLADLPPPTTLPGLIGHFQIDTAGAFSTPLLPSDPTEAGNYGITAAELRQRQAISVRLFDILRDNRLVRSDRKATVAASATGDDEPGLAPDDARNFLPSPMSSPVPLPQEAGDRAAAQAEEAVGQAAFDRLTQRARDPRRGPVDTFASGRIEDLRLDESMRSKAQQQLPASPAAPTLEERLSRKERRAIAQSAAPREAEVSTETAKKARGGIGGTQLQIHTFESEVDPFEFSPLGSGHLVLYRRVWRNGQRMVQGALLEREPFLRAVVERGFRESTIATMSRLLVAQQGQIVADYAAQAVSSYPAGNAPLRGALLHRTRLSPPLDEMELIFTVTTLPIGPGGTVVALLTAILFTVLSAGIYGLYRLGIRQIELAGQQQDFVSAVSHELKTPLTSIRMYGEMLREGWVSEEKRHEYYRYIHDESERLSRLINNVLQFARMSRNELDVALKPVTVGELMDTIRSKIASQVERAGYALNPECPDACRGGVVSVDQDGFTQIIINLVDNAIKFSARSDRREIEVTCQAQQDGTLRFRVRDYGPGIPRDQMKKIFQLFYRSENELTRETMGTGIGLALVKQLTLAMKGRVNVINANPGAAFEITFPLIETQSRHAIE